MQRKAVTQFYQVYMDRCGARDITSHAMQVSIFQLICRFILICIELLNVIYMSHMISEALFLRTKSG